MTGSGGETGEETPRWGPLRGDVLFPKRNHLFFQG